MLKRGIVLGLLSGAVALGVPGIASAQDAPNEAKPLVEFKPKLSGYIEGWYRSDDSDLSSQATAAKKVDNEFRVRRARLTASGNITEELSYKLQAALDGPIPASAAATVKLWDAYMAYKFSPYAIVSAGQLKYDFTLEGLEATPDRVPVLRAEVTNDIASKLGTRGGSFRDIGVKVNGSVKEALGLTYGAGFFNGSGINAGDNNADKDIVGRVTVSPVQNLTIGVSGYTGKGQDETGTFEVKESAYGIDAEYVNWGLRLRGEYVAGKWENWNVATAVAVAGATQKPNGWYVQASYKLPPLPAVEVLGRYEDYEKDSNTANSHLKTTTVGATYYVKGKTRFTANYLMRDADANTIVTAQETDATGTNIGNLFILQALLAF